MAPKVLLNSILQTAFQQQHNKRFTYLVLQMKFLYHASLHQIVNKNWATMDLEYKL